MFSALLVNAVKSCKYVRLQMLEIRKVSPKQPDSLSEKTKNKNKNDVGITNERLKRHR